MSLRDTKKNHTAHAILESAIDLLADRGVDAAPVDLIARRAGVAVGSIYTHYGSKEGLCAAVIDHAAEQAEVALLARQPALTVGTPLERLSAVGRAYTRFAFDRPKEFRLLAHYLLRAGAEPTFGGSDLASDVFERAVDRIAGQIARATEMRELAPTDPREAAMFLIGAWTGVLSMASRGQLPTREAVRIASTLEQAALALASGASQGPGCGPEPEDYRQSA